MQIKEVDENITKLLVKLASIQNQFIAKKSEYNEFGGYRYRTCEVILEDLKPILLSHCCTVLFNDELLHIGDRYYIQSTVTIFDIDTGAHLSTSAIAREDEARKKMDGSQLTGAASTYARKYALGNLFIFDDRKDSDGLNDGKERDYNIVVCPTCKTTIQETKLKSGKILTPAETLSKFGMCATCYMKAREENINNE